VPTNLSKIGQKAIDNMVMYIGQTLPDTEVVERQLRVVDAQFDVISTISVILQEHLSKSRFINMSLRQNAIDNMAMDIGETPPDTVVVERQLRMVDAK